MFIQDTIEEKGEEIEKDVRHAYPDQNSVASLIYVHSLCKQVGPVKEGLTEWTVVFLVNIHLTILLIEDRISGECMFMYSNNITSLEGDIIHAC